MGRPRVPKIQPITRRTTRKDIARVLYVVGRVGKLLEQQGYDPSKLYFVPGGSGCIEELNPNCNLTNSQFKKLFKEAADFVGVKVKFLEKKYNITSLAEIVEKMADFLIHPDACKYFENTVSLKREEFERIETHIVDAVCNFRTINVGTLSVALNIARNNFHVQERKITLSFQKPHYHCLDHEKLYEFKKISLKLSSYGRRALRKFLNEQKGKVSNFRMIREDMRISIPLGAVGYTYEHTDVRKVSNVLQSAVRKMFTDFLKEAIRQFKRRMRNQPVTMNGIELTSELKDALFSQIDPILDVSGLNYFSKVFKALRDSRDLDATSMEMLTSNSEKLREAGLALAKLKTLLEDRDNEENAED